MSNKILAVDDNKDILYTLQAIAEVAGFDLTPISKGGEALKILKQKSLDLVIVDYYMPDMNGLELVEKIRNFNSKIPLLVLTVDESLEIARRFMDAGATDFASKPIRAADLISRIRLHLELSKLKEPLSLDLKQEDIPKGMSGQTLQLIGDYLAGTVKPQSIEEISQGTGLAYQTAHRYLAFLEQEGLLNADLIYGKVGRPIKKYEIKKDINVE